MLLSGSTGRLTDMSQSPLATYKHISPNCTKPRRDKIRGVAIHCTAGSPNHTAKQIIEGSRFITPSKTGASCHYAVGGDGSIAQGCLEENRSWCTSHTIDHSIIAIEVASDTEGLIVNQKAIDALVKLLIDICGRNNIPQLLWQGNKSLMGNWDKQNMVVHRWTAAKSCPGDTLYNLHSEIAKRVNAKLTPAKPVKKENELEMTKAEFLDSLTPEEAYKLMTKANLYAGTVAEPDWSKAEGSWSKAREKNVFNTDTPEAFITRSQVAAILNRLKLF